MGTEEGKQAAGMEAPEPAKPFKPPGLTQASFSYKAIPVASDANAASEIITGFMEEHLLRRALEVPVETYEPPSLSQRWLDRPVQVSVAMELSSVRMVAGVGEMIEELGFESKCKKISKKEAGGGDRLRNNHDVYSPMAKVGIEDSLAETGCTYQDIPAKRPRLDQTLLDDDGAINTGLPSQDTATIMAEPKNLILTVDPLGCQSMPTKEEQAEITQRRKTSNGRKDKESKVGQRERKMLDQRVEKLSSEMSKLTQELLRMSEQCQEMTEQNDLILDELRAEYGPEEISDLLDSNPASSSHESDNSREKSSGDDSSPGDR